MKKLISKFLLAALAALLAAGMMTVRAETVLQEMALDEHETVGGFPGELGRITFVPDEGVIGAASHIIFEVEGTVGDDIYENIQVIAWGAPMWWGAYFHLHDAIIDGNRVILDISDWDTAEILLMDWSNENQFPQVDNYRFITRVLFVTDFAPPAAAAAAPAAPGVGGEVNPQTGDSFTTTALVVSGVGFVGALAALAFVSKKKK